MKFIIISFLVFGYVLIVNAHPANNTVNVEYATYPMQEQGVRLENIKVSITRELSTYFRNIPECTLKKQSLKITTKLIDTLKFIGLKSEHNQINISATLDCATDGYDIEMNYNNVPNISKDDILTVTLIKYGQEHLTEELMICTANCGN